MDSCQIVSIISNSRDKNQLVDKVLQNCKQAFFLLSGQRVHVPGLYNKFFTYKTLITWIIFSIVDHSFTNKFFVQFYETLLRRRESITAKFGGRNFSRMLRGSLAPTIAKTKDF